MKKNLFISVIGLMSLLTVLSSCEDHFTYDKEKNFSPVGYDAKIPAQDCEVSDTILIKGVQGLVFDEIEKKDWKIITQSEIFINGNKPLKVNSDMIEIDEDSPIVQLETNYGFIPVTFSNTTVKYTYMDKEIELSPLEDFQFSVRLEDVEESQNEFYMQVGTLVFRLYIGNIPVKIHKVMFSVTDIPNQSTTNSNDSDK